MRSSGIAKSAARAISLAGLVLLYNRYLYYSGTIAYGLLSARIADPHTRTADDFAAHMRTNPFLRELMETFLKVGGRRGRLVAPASTSTRLGVSEVVELLDNANMEAVVRDFGDRNSQEDPVIHFYEAPVPEPATIMAVSYLPFLRFSNALLRTVASVRPHEARGDCSSFWAPSRRAECGGDEVGSGMPLDSAEDFLSPT